MRPSEITKIRRRMKMSGQAFSDLMGMSRSSLSKWENERVEPGNFWSCILGALAYVLDCRTAEQAREFKKRLIKANTEHGQLSMYEVILVSFIQEIQVVSGGMSE
jgi:transcriptional regulator with XRE-family HTH domain